MNKTKQTNNIPKSIKYLLYFIPLLGLFLIDFTLDNDTYFLMSIGREIIKNGFPNYDILTFHTSMEIVVQQWIPCVIYYLSYLLIGKLGPIFVCCIFYMLFSISIIRLCNLISNNIFISAITSSLITYFCAHFYFVTRPQIFSILLFSLELIIFESYSKTGKKQYLCFLPLLSLMLINTHASVWLLFFVFALPYLVSTFKFQLIKKYSTTEGNLLLITFSLVISFLIGFLNPYGIKNMLYIFNSYGIDYINKHINEMNPVSINTTVGKFFYIIIGVIIASIIAKKRDIDVRYLLMFCGTLALGITSYKALLFFIALGIPCVSHYHKDITINISSINNRTKKDNIILICVSCCLLLSISSLVYFKIDSMNSPYEESILESEEKIVDIIKKDPNWKNAKIYTGFDLGSYFEFYELKVYIDPRAEIFIDKNNKDFNYLKEYVDLYDGKSKYSDFINKYNFDYLVVMPSETYLYNSLSNDSNYELVKEVNSIKLFAPKKVSH